MKAGSNPRGVKTMEKDMALGELAEMTQVKTAKRGDAPSQELEPGRASPVGMGIRGSVWKPVKMARQSVKRQ